MSFPIESVVKLLLVALLVVAGLVALLPRRRTPGRPVISEKLFVTTCLVGAVCGAVGLAVLFAWPQRVLGWHLWELAAMPLVLLYAYWIAMARAARTDRTLDEKQDFDMTRAAALTSSFSVPVMCVPFAVAEKSAFDGGLWFPYFLFVTLFMNSGITLYYFKRR
jgi:Ca2+/Na+ antiporter